MTRRTNVTPKELRRLAWQAIERKALLAVDPRAVLDILDELGGYAELVDEAHELLDCSRPDEDAITTWLLDADLASGHISRGEYEDAFAGVRT